MPADDPGDDRHDADLELLVQAARGAGEIARRHFGTGPQSWDKGDGQGPVSEADLEIDAHLRDLLTGARPGYGWLSEESADDGARLSRTRAFVVDPIDGTRAFLAGESTFSHSLAVVEAGTPVVAVVYVPLLDRLYAAGAGGGATCNGTGMSVSGRAGCDGATVLGARSSFADALWKGGCPPVSRAFRPSLAYRLALVAEGRFDAMVTLRPAWEWDIAAGALLVTEAGGRVADRHGRALRFNRPDARLDGVVAGAPAVAGELLGRVV